MLELEGTVKAREMKGGPGMRIHVTTIKLLQVKKGLTQSQLAEKAGFSRQGLNGILQRGTCAPESVVKIARALDIDPELIIREE